MSFIEKWLSGSIFSPSDEQNKPSVYGGDGISPETAAIVNCYSMPVANRLIDRFISKLQGEKYADWKREIESFVNKPEITEFTIRTIGIVTTLGERYTYYFDVSQPMRASMNLVRAMTEEKISFLDRCLNALKIRR